MLSKGVAGILQSDTFGVAMFLSKVVEHSTPDMASGQGREFYASG